MDKKLIIDEIANVNFLRWHLHPLLRSAVRPEATEFSDIMQIRAMTPLKVIQGHRFWYDFLFVINTNLPSSVLHRFLISHSLRLVQNRYIWLPLLCSTAPTEGLSISYHHKWYIAKKLDTLGYISVAESLGRPISSTAVRPGSYRIRWNNVK